MGTTDLYDPKKVHHALMTHGSDRENSPLQEAMLEWYKQQPLEVQERTCEVCSELVNAVALRKGRKVWFGPLSALQVIGALLAVIMRWKRIE